MKSYSEVFIGTRGSDDHTGRELVMIGRGGSDFLAVDTSTLTPTHATIYGGGGDDFLYGSSLGDTLYGGKGDDFLMGWPGDADMIYGGRGRDLIYGDGEDVIRGGRGRDEFFFGVTSSFLGSATIEDFNPGRDKLWFSAKSAGYDPETGFVSADDLNDAGAVAVPVVYIGEGFDPAEVNIILM